jgi:serine/threonine-protein kinase
MSTGKSLFGYRVLHRLGQGAASELYLVQDLKSKHIWALKHVTKRTEKDQRFLDQVEQEYQIGSKLAHENVRSIEKLIKHRKLFKVSDVALIMEYVDAASIDQRPPRSQKEAVRIFAQTARGLAHMHSRGYVHADIKPSNVLVDDKGCVKIIDLGQACPIGTVKKRIQGTPGYMAPEQAHRQAITPRTDIYNFGATMYWTLVGECVPTALPPKDDQNRLYSGAIDPARVEPPVPPHVKNPSIHQLLSRLILDCVELDERARPDSMARVAERLGLIGELLESPPEAPPPLQGDEDTLY